MYAVGSSLCKLAILLMSLKERYAVWLHAIYWCSVIPLTITCTACSCPWGTVFSQVLRGGFKCDVTVINRSKVPTAAASCPELSWNIFCCCHLMGPVARDDYIAEAGFFTLFSYFFYASCESVIMVLYLQLLLLMLTILRRVRKVRGLVM